MPRTSTAKARKTLARKSTKKTVRRSAPRASPPPAAAVHAPLTELDILEEFSVEIVKGRSALDKCCICDREYISESYERLALEQVEDEHVYGVFLYKQKVLAAYVIYEIRGNLCEVNLLCSNKALRVGAATKLMRYLLYKTKEYRLASVQLKVAQESRNARAVAFYESLGFKRTAQGHYVY